MSRPIPYRVRVSNRARYARLQVDPREGLLVVVPRRFPLASVPGLVEERRDWVEKTLRRLGVEDHAEAAEPPHELLLAGIGERFAVHYRRADATAPARARGEVLEVAAPDDASAITALGRFVERRARSALGARLEELAERRDRRVVAVSVRNQKTRWGSCSAAGAISLNRNLVFLPPALSDSVLIHELCHLDELNHSPRFWALVAEEVPDLARRRAELRRAWGHVPLWAR